MDILRSTPYHSQCLFCPSTKPNFRNTVKAFIQSTILGVKKDNSDIDYEEKRYFILISKISVVLDVPDIAAPSEFILKNMVFVGVRTGVASSLPTGNTWAL